MAKDHSTPTVDLDGIKESFAVIGRHSDFRLISFKRITVAGQRQILTGFPCSMQKVHISGHNNRIPAITIGLWVSALFPFIAI
jgi:hypothetical protein